MLSWGGGSSQYKTSWLREIIGIMENNRHWIAQDVKFLNLFNQLKEINTDCGFGRLPRQTNIPYMEVFGLSSRPPRKPDKDIELKLVIYIQPWLWLGVSNQRRTKADAAM